MFIMGWINLPSPRRRNETKRRSGKRKRKKIGILVHVFLSPFALLCIRKAKKCLRERDHISRSCRADPSVNSIYTAEGKFQLFSSSRLCCVAPGICSMSSLIFLTAALPSLSHGWCLFNAQNGSRTMKLKWKTCLRYNFSISTSNNS